MVETCIMVFTCDNEECDEFKAFFDFQDLINEMGGVSLESIDHWVCDKCIKEMDNPPQDDGEISDEAFQSRAAGL